MSRHSPEVSVIVAARNAEPGVAKLLDHLRAQTLAPERFEILIVDDCSTDGTFEVVERSGIARALRTPRRGGAYAARNVGLHEARGAVIAITDADCEPTPAWLEGGLADLDALGVDLLGGHIDVPLRRAPSAAELVDFCRYLDQRRALEEAGFAATANLFVRRKVVDHVGRFNERVISGGDREFCQRATRAGFRIAYSARAAIVHEPRLTARDLMRKTYRMGIGRAQIRAYADGPSRDRPCIWRSPGAYVLRPGVYGAERLVECDYRPSRRERLQMELAQYAWVQIPMIAGNMVGSWRLRAGGPA